MSDSDSDDGRHAVRSRPKPRRHLLKDLKLEGRRVAFYLKRVAESTPTRSRASTDVTLSTLIGMHENGVNGILRGGTAAHAVSMLLHLREQRVKGPFLIVVPDAAAASRWVREVARRMPGGSHNWDEEVHCSDPHKSIVHLVSYARVRSIGNSFPFKYAVIDEGIKNATRLDEIEQIMHFGRDCSKIIISSFPMTRDRNQLTGLLRFFATDQSNIPADVHLSADEAVEALQILRARTLDAQACAGSAELIRASVHGEVAEVARLLSAGVPASTDHFFGLTPLILAAMHAHDDVVQRLLEAKADISK
eukprot:4518235-Prymnesium_polylepis.1